MPTIPDPSDELIDHVEARGLTKGKLAEAMSAVGDSYPYSLHAELTHAKAIDPELNRWTTRLWLAGIAAGALDLIVRPLSSGTPVSIPRVYANCSEAETALETGLFMLSGQNDPALAMLRGYMGGVLHFCRVQLQTFLDTAVADAVRLRLAGSAGTSGSRAGPAGGHNFLPQISASPPTMGPSGGAVPVRKPQSRAAVQAAYNARIETDFPPSYRAPSYTEDMLGRKP
jgi:hypothetical protein